VCANYPYLIVNVYKERNVIHYAIVTLRLYDNKNQCKAITFIPSRHNAKIYFLQALPLPHPQRSLIFHFVYRCSVALSTPRTGWSTTEALPQKNVVLLPKRKHF